MMPRLTTHSTGARIGWFSLFIIAAYVECYMPRPVNSGVMPLLVMSIFVALLEVMDKELSLLQIWILFLLIGVGGFLLCRYRRWLIVLILPVALIAAGGHLSELYDPYVGPAIAQEAGGEYFTQSYIAMALGVTLPLLATIRRKRKLP